MTEILFPTTWNHHRARPLRLERYPALPVHVILTTYRRYSLFRDARNAEPVFRCFAEHERTLALALMPDHLHWLLADASGLPDVMRRVKSFTTREVRRATGVGRIWQRSYFDAVIRDAALCGRVARYIVENPVRAGLCGEGRTYPWVFLAPEMGGG